MHDNYIQFEDIVEMGIIAKFAKSFFNITGLILDIDDPNAQHPKKYYSILDENNFCRIIKNTVIGAAECIICCKLEGKLAAKIKEPRIFQCHAGLTDVSVPILIRERHIATLATGQVLTHKPTMKEFRKTLKAVKDYGVNHEKLKTAYFNSPVLNLQKLHDYINLIELVISHIIEIEDKIIFLKQSISNNFCIERAKTYIEENYERKICADEVAKNSFLSKYYFLHLFKKETGNTFLEYLNFLRIMKAKKMLTTKAISQVCFDIGFSSLPHFYKMFEKYVGCKPKEYVNSIKS